MSPDRKIQEGDVNMIRPLGLHEGYHEVSSIIWKGLDNCILVAAKYTLGDTVLDKRTLYAALAQVISQQPALCVVIDGHRTPRPFFRRLVAINLSEVVHFVEDDVGVAAAMEAQFALPMNENAPIWRLAVLKDNTVILAIDHAIADGQSGDAFHISLLSALNALPLQSGQASDVKEIIEVQENIALSPPPENVLNTRVGFCTMANVLWDMFAPTFLSKQAKAWSGNPQPTLESADLSVSVRLLHFDPQQVEVLRKIAREHDATVTSVLHTISVIVISRLISASSSADSKEFDGVFTYCPISLRRYTGTPPTAICDEVSTYGSYWPLIKLPGDSSTASNPGVSPEFPWAEASRFASELKAYAPRSAEQLGLLRLVSNDFEGYIKSKQGKKRQAALELSNLGPFPSVASPRSGADVWQIEEMYFAQPGVTTGAALKLNVMGTPSGGLGISVTWGVSTVEDDFAGKFADGVEETILEMVGAK